MKYTIVGLLIFFVVMSLASYYNFRRQLTIYRNVLEMLEKYPDYGIGWYLSMASALIKSQQLKDALDYLIESKGKFSDFLVQNPHVAKEIDMNIRFCYHPVPSVSTPINAKPNWFHYVMVNCLGNEHANNISKQTMERVSLWVKQGKP